MCLAMRRRYRQPPCKQIGLRSLQHRRGGLGRRQKGPAAYNSGWPAAGLGRDDNRPGASPEPTSRWLIWSRPRFNSAELAYLKRHWRVCIRRPDVPPPACVTHMWCGCGLQRSVQIFVAQSVVRPGKRREQAGVSRRTSRSLAEIRDYLTRNPFQFGNSIITRPANNEF